MAKAFARAPGMHHTRPSAFPLPAGTKTLLLRTFAVATIDGLWHDSGIPEEVLVRTFTNEAPALDPKSSDYLGTRVYQWKMRRGDLLRGHMPWGLRSIHEDEVQFAGFFAEVPDNANTVGEPVTTMRYNCITCHSTLYYGASTVFSFNLDPRGHTRRPGDIQVLLQPEKNGFELRSSEWETLHRLIAAPREERVQANSQGP